MDKLTNVSNVKGLKWFGHTDIGKVRANNEDAFLGLQFDSQNVNYLGKIGEASTINQDFAFAVSDGMGGAKAGEFASRIAVEKITKLLPRSFRQAASGLERGCADLLAELFDQIHRALAYVGNSYEECAGMESTLSLCWFTEGQVYFAHIGDSRVYYLPARTGIIRQLSQDDTHVAWLLRNGMINQREARNHPRRRVLQKSLGGDNQFVEPQVGAVECEPGDIFLICSDGLTEGLEDALLVEHLNQVQLESQNENIAQRLVKVSVDRDGSDNTTALVIQVV